MITLGERKKIKLYDDSKNETFFFDFHENGMAPHDFNYQPI